MKKNYFQILAAMALFLVAAIPGMSQSYTMSGTPITTCSGTYYDPGGLSQYGNNLVVVQTISPSTPGSKVRINFSSFSLEDGYDFLSIHDGNSTGAPIIGTFTGTTIPSQITATATNSSGALTFRFSSDGTLTENGWVGSLSCVSGSSSGYVMSSTPVTTCSGTFSDPGGSGNYPNNQFVTQTFTPASSGSKLRFNFSSFDVEAGYDYLAVFDGPSTSSPLINYYTGTVSPGTITATNPTGELTFQFYSDNIQDAPGWSAAISCVSAGSAGVYSMSNAPITTCNASWYDPAGSSSSFFYGNNLNITQTISPSTSGSKVQVSFSAFSLENGFDYLYAYDGPSTSSPLIGSFTGNTIPGSITATNASGVLTFRFTSNASTGAAGWSASISCVGAVAAPTVTSFSPTSGPVGTSVTVNGTNFSGATTVTVGGVPASFSVINSTTIVLTVPAGAVTGPIVVTTGGGSGSSSSNFTVTGSSGTIVMSASPVTTCTGTYMDPGGVGNYGDNLYVVQTLTPATAGSKLQVAFSSFNIQNGYDMLAVYDGPSTSSPLINYYTNNVSPGTITATNPTGELTFEFISDNTTNASGWSASVSCVTTAGPGVFSMSNAPITTCNAAWYDPAGSSPSFFYGNNLNITQTISPSTAGAKVRVNFTAFSLESGYDYLYAYDGPSTSSPLIGTFTGTTIPAQITATNAAGQLTFRFTSDGSTGASGWAANISCFSPVTPPTITSFSPASGPAGTSVTVTGTNFTGATSVTVNGTPVTFSVVNGTTLVLTIPAGATSGPIAITTGSGTATSSTNFTVTVPCTTPTATIATACTSAATQTVSFNLTGQAPWNVNYTVNGVPQLADNIIASPFVLTINPTGITTYTLTGVSSGSCVGSASGSITVAPKITPTATDGSGCANTAVTLSAAGATSYYWYTTATGGSAIAQTPSYTTPVLTTTTTYFVSAVNAYGCEGARVAVTANINAAPVVNAGASQTICENSAPVTLSGFSPAGGTWSGTGVTAGGVFTPNASMVGSVTLTYTVTQNGCSASATKTITVNAAPVVTAGVAQTACANNAAFQLTGYSPGGGTWSGIGVSPQGTFDPSVSGAGTFPLTYSVTVNGCTSTATKNVTVSQAPATPGITIVPGDSLRATVGLVGATYTWTLNGITMPANTQTIKANTSGTYTVQVTNAAGCVSAVSGSFNYTVTGVNESLTNNLTIFPNPTTGMVTISLKTYLPKAELRVLNMLGQEVAFRNLATNNNKAAVQLDLGSVAKGVYFIRISGEGQVITRKLVVE